jgi:hypothetical protein
LEFPSQLMAASRRRCRRVPLLAMAAVGTGCTPFKSDPPCSHRAPPPRPTVTQEVSSLPDLVFAIRQSENALRDDAGQRSYGEVGFDLDDTCTGEGQGPSCAEPSWATASHKDGVDGIDNAWGQISPESVHVDGSTPTMLFRVGSYSGQPDDDQVEVSLYAGFGLAPRGDAGDGGGDLLWDGHDQWKIMPEMLVPSASPSVEQPLYRDSQAYVSAGTLVAHFPKALWSPMLWVPSNPAGPNTLVPASGVVLAGLLDNVGGQWMLKDAVVDMRIRMNDGLTFAAQSPSGPAAGDTLCQNPVAYYGALQAFCAAVDIASVPGLPSSAPCDALSTAALFQASPALLGEVLPPSQAVALKCAPGIHPATDDCEPPQD